MTQALFLVPGLLLDPRVRPEIDAATLARAAELSKQLADDALFQAFDSSAFSRSVHLMWLWSVLMRRPGLPQTAPYAWAVDQGPQMTANTVWRLHAAHLADNGVIKPVNLTDAANESLASVLTAPLSQAGFLLQRWDTELYLTAKTKPQVAARPFEALAGFRRNLDTDIEGLDDDPASAGAARVAFARQLLELEKVLAGAGIVSDGQPVNALWIDGAGTFANVYPPTKIRSVLTDDAAVTGWALAAGILNHRLGAAAGATEWPADAPDGDRIAVIGDLYGPWLARDWRGWSEKLPAVIEQIRTLGEAARKKGCESSLVVACGTGATVTLAKKLSHPKSLLARLARGRQVAAADWLFLGGCESSEEQTHNPDETICNPGGAGGGALGTPAEAGS